MSRFAPKLPHYVEKLIARCCFSTITALLGINPLTLEAYSSQICCVTHMSHHISLSSLPLSLNVLSWSGMGTPLEWYNSSSSSLPGPLDSLLSPVTYLAVGRANMGYQRKLFISGLISFSQRRATWRQSWMEVGLKRGNRKERAKGAEMWLDGQRVKGATGAWTPGPLTAAVLRCSAAGQIIFHYLKQSIE